MATQYTAGLTTGQVLTAATMNSIGAEWETWTPVFTASAGTLTTTVLNLARYSRIQKTVFVQIDMQITNIGTGSGILQISLPFTARSGILGLSVGTFREINVTGFTGITSLDSTTSMSLKKYDNASYLANNNRYTMSYTYEAA